ncbi:peptidoglycan recognition protein family protein [Natrinema halophilum]|uniref:N-acetylmuramoyl-L-alanine amidase n=1 Tax=Natrinema halophilum TaxID=1699371 RepID=A0A7D5H2G0_9EURY|nr:peptidoglycan recognition family protein [Natrinema halophilum]QLG49051.1 N-acetylmuramoyl-L-alanine amidase [Natrinema halophilum]
MERRPFLTATVLSAGIGELYAVGSSTARAHSRTQAEAADRFVAADSTNYSGSSRDAADIDWIVIHCTVGRYAGAISHFQTPSANVSAHYVISNYEHTDYAPGHVTQMVPHEDVAWHARGSNTSSIGIEHEWHRNYGRYFTDECYRASAAVVRELAERYDVPLEYYEYGSAHCNESGGIIGHRHAPQDSACNHLPSKSCPGPDWDPGIFMKYVRNGGSGNDSDGSDSSDSSDDGGDSSDDGSDSSNNGGDSSNNGGGSSDDGGDSSNNGGDSSDDGGDGGDGSDGNRPFEMEDGAVTTADLNGREGPGLDYGVVETLPAGSVGRIMNGPETNDGIRWWGLHFSTHDVWVWCSENYLSRVAFHVDETVTTTTALRARQAPGLGYTVKRVLPQGTTETIVNGPETNDGIRWWGLYVPAYDLWGWSAEPYLVSNE